MPYVDGFVAAVPTANKAAFEAHCKVAIDVFLEAGAIQYTECWGDDLPRGEMTDFYRAVQAKDDETVIFSWIIWPDKAARDAGMEKAMADSRLNMEDNPMPFDGKRMIFGGFNALVHVGKNAAS
ncbi:MAG: DUF1428 domain-containing protein [Pseudomonadota bacterium]